MINLLLQLSFLVGVLFYIAQCVYSEIVQMNSLIYSSHHLAIDKYFYLLFSREVDSCNI